MRYVSAAAAAVEIIPGSDDEQAGNTTNSKYPLSITRRALALWSRNDAYGGK